MRKFLDSLRQNPFTGDIEGDPSLLPSVSSEELEDPCRYLNCDLPRDPGESDLDYMDRVDDHLSGL